MLRIAFASWRSALPWFPIATLAQDEVALLVELLADDRARTRVSDSDLERAIRKVGSAEQDWNRAVPTPQADLDARVGRLGAGARPLPVAAKVLVSVLSVALVVLPIVLLASPYR